MTSVVEHGTEAFVWQAQPKAAALLGEILATFQARCPGVNSVAERLVRQTGTRLVDWVDHFALPASEDWAVRLAEVGFQPGEQQPAVWEHPGALLPWIKLLQKPTWGMAIRVESVADFLAANGIDESQAAIVGEPLDPLRRARIASGPDAELWIVERHGMRGWEPRPASSDQLKAVLHHEEAFRRRRRRFAREEEGFEYALQLIHAAVGGLGIDRTCDLFFAAEREYWTRRNRAAQVQKARQDGLGLGWANHDHHTYRSSREHFTRLIGVLEELGLVCRERFYAGREAGWGAQVLEQPVAGIVVFADVDLSPEEVSGDFAHEPLAPRDRLGTVGLWCKLHGEAFLQAGMHHLECRFDFDAARDQLLQAGIRTMKPFTDLPYLKQAFTEGDIWPVRPERIKAAHQAGAITGDEAAQFRQAGAIGSHLEILQRDQGYRGFSQSGINEIIRDTDPRRK